MYSIYAAEVGRGKQRDLAPFNGLGALMLG
jgi:hypothetical protein